MIPGHHWVFHSYYFGWQIDRFFDDDQPKMQYHATAHGQTLKAGNLARIKEAVKQAEAARKGASE